MNDRTRFRDKLIYQLVITNVVLFVFCFGIFIGSMAIISYLGDYEIHYPKPHPFLNPIFTAVVILIISINFGVFLSIKFSKKFLRPINALQNGMKEVKNGNFNIQLKNVYNNETKNLIENFNLMVNELQKSETLKSDFISNVSHELRTPVTVLRSYIDTLYNFGNDFDFNTQREFIGVMNQEIIRLNRMVNDILDFSRYESQNIRLEKSKQNIVEIIEDCVNQVQVLAKEHDLTVSIMKEPDLPEIYLNIDSISRALMNIVSNAINSTRRSL